jgi:hypothetical protein
MDISGVSVPAAHGAAGKVRVGDVAAVQVQKMAQDMQADMAKQLVDSIPDAITPTPSTGPGQLLNVYA